MDSLSGEQEIHRLLDDSESQQRHQQAKGTRSPVRYGTANITPTSHQAVHLNKSNHEEEDEAYFKPLQERGWSFQEGRRSVMTNGHLHGGPSSSHYPQSPASSYQPPPPTTSKGPSFYFSCVIYALVNVIISAPGLYGYAAVIFNHPVFADHMNSLSKLVIFSSLIHQLGFFLFSSLDFAIGTVQDAGLIFLSGMANKIAERMLEEGHSKSEVVSTTLVLLSIGTAALGIVLVVMGHFRLADAVSYLPMPVVGGYLAFIGFFCIQAGIALCISKSITTLGEWKYIFEAHNLLLATPGLLAGLVLTLVSRKATNSGVLPSVMVAIPALFYFILWWRGATLDDVREEGWVGPVAPSVPVGDLFKLVNFGEVRWDIIAEIFPTWIGMVFVVSFASCLDVAAISIDMGEALDTNRELATVGLCNFMSGLTFGFTGSYIFSQTIFTFRTGVHSRWIGVLIMGVFLYIVVSPVNVLQISPLFFLGSTLIFIGYDLMWEWLWEVREQVFLSEYGIVWLTFLAIHAVGIDAGIIMGVLIAVVEQIVTTAQTSSVVQVDRRSRAVWTPSDSELLHDYGYSSVGGARIITLEMHGTVFFGSSLSLLNSILQRIGLGADDFELGSPGPVHGSTHKSSAVLNFDRKPSGITHERKPSGISHDRKPSTVSQISVRTPFPSTLPKFLVLDLSQITHLDASATRGTFLQLVKMCAKDDIVVCASGATPRIEWMFRSHGVSIADLDDENAAKAKLLGQQHFQHPPRAIPQHTQENLDKILLFMTIHEALEFCENLLLHRLNRENRPPSLALMDGPHERSLADVIAHMLNSDEAEAEVLKQLDSTRYHDEIDLRSGEYIFHRRTYPDSFYIVLSGVVANAPAQDTSRASRQELPVVSGAGVVSLKRVGSASTLIDDTFRANNTARMVSTLWQVGGVFGYNDYLLDRPRGYSAIATLDGTKVARISHSHMNLARTDNPELYSLLQTVLLHASTKDLANCTCHDV